MRCQIREMADFYRAALVVQLFSISFDRFIIYGTRINKGWLSAIWVWKKNLENTIDEIEYTHEEV